MEFRLVGSGRRWFQWGSQGGWGFSTPRGQMNSRFNFPSLSPLILFFSSSSSSSSSSFPFHSLFLLPPSLSLSLSLSLGASRGSAAKWGRPTPSRTPTIDTCKLSILDESRPVASLHHPIHISIANNLKSIFNAKQLILS